MDSQSLGLQCRESRGIAGDLTASTPHFSLRLSDESQSPTITSTNLPVFSPTLLHSLRKPLCRIIVPFRLSMMQDISSVVTPSLLDDLDIVLPLPTLHLILSELILLQQIIQHLLQPLAVRLQRRHHILDRSFNQDSIDHPEALSI